MTDSDTPEQPKKISGHRRIRDYMKEHRGPSRGEINAIIMGYTAKERLKLLEQLRAVPMEAIRDMPRYCLSKGGYLKRHWNGRIVKYSSLRKLMQ